MTTLFVFGTLRDTPLLEIVAGALPKARPAWIADHAVYAVKDEAFPVMRPASGQRAEGLLLEGLTDEMLARFDFYETIFAYARHTVMVGTGQGAVETDVYLPTKDPGPEDGLWSLEDWTARHAALNRAAAADLMARRHHDSPEALASLYPFMRARAWTRLRAGHTPAPTALRRHAVADDVAVLQDATPFQGFFQFKTFSVSGRQFDDTMGPVLERECFVGFDAALVLPYDPISDQVLVVEQLRFGPLWRGDPQPWTLEPIAGMMDAGEDPQETARREAMEEAGLTLSELISITGVYPAPGYVTEFYHCFLGVTRLCESQAGVGGLISESENIRSHVLSFDAAMALVDSGEINIAPLVMMLLWLARHRARLRADAL